MADRPRLLEDIYTAADAVVVGSLLITLLKNSDRVRSASLAQLVNAIAPIMTEPGGIAWRQTTFYPFATTSRLARGRVLLPRIDSPLTTTGRQGEVALVDAVATYDPETGDGAYFLVNRSSTEPVEVEVTSTQPALPIESALLHEDDAYARNTMTEPDRVTLKTLNVGVEPGMVTAALPPASWAAIAFTSKASPTS